MRNVSKKAKSILIIDVCKSTRDALIKDIGRAYPLLVATTAREGIGLLSEEVAVVILDLALPDAYGIAVLRRIKETHPSVPVIITAAYETEETIIAAFRAGARDYIKKPLDPDEVLNKISVLAGMLSDAGGRRHMMLGSESGPRPRHGEIPSCIIEGILRVKAYIEKNYALPLTLSEACRISLLNRSYFCAYFKRITGHSFKSYHHFVRIRKAIELMEKADRTVSEIAGMIGYENASYFSATFKKETGITPKHYILGAQRAYK